MTPEIPQTRRSFEDKQSLRYRDPLKNFLTNDPRWESLPGYFQLLVTVNAHEIRHLVPEELTERAKELDKEALTHPYLSTLKEKEGDLMDLHATMTDIISQQTDTDEKDYDGASDRLIKMFVASRQLGKKMADQFGWDPRNGFGQYTRHAQISIDICTKAVKEILP